jgi:hypothetical protein
VNVFPAMVRVPVRDEVEELADTERDGIFIRLQHLIDPVLIVCFMKMNTITGDVFFR